MAEIRVYIKFGAVPDSQKREFLKRLQKALSPAMTLSERSGTASVKVEGQDPTAAVIAVQLRAEPIRSQLGLADDQVTWLLEPPLA